MTCEVVRAFESGGKTLAVGTVVDATGWRWANELIAQGYLRMLAFAPPSSASATPSGRKKEG